VPKNEHVKVVPRDQPVTPVRVASVFADIKSTEPGGAYDRKVDVNQTSVLDKQREIVKAENIVKSDETSSAEDDCVHYEQLQTPTCWLKLGMYYLPFGVLDVSYFCHSSFSVLICLETTSLSILHLLYQLRCISSFTF